MKKIFTKEVNIGLSVVVAIVILVFGMDYLKGINLFNPTNFYVAYYDNVAGLEKSAPVTIDGYKIGQVRDIVFDYEKHGKLKVVLALDKELKLPEDSYATIESTLLSGSFISITPGKSKKMLAIGSDIKTQQGSDLMSNLSNDVMPAVTQMVTKIDLLLANLNRVVSDPALLASVQRLDGITGNVYDACADLRLTMSNDVPLIMKNANRTVTHIDSIAINLALLSRQLKTLPLQPTMENVQQITENLNHFSNQLNNQSSTLGQLTNDAELYNRLNRVSADIDSLIIDIKKNPKRYINIKLL